MSKKELSLTPAPELKTAFNKTWKDRFYPAHGFKNELSHAHYQGVKESSLDTWPLVFAIYKMKQNTFPPYMLLIYNKDNGDYSQLHLKGRPGFDTIEEAMAAAEEFSDNFKDEGKE